MIDRATKLLKARDVKFQFACAHPKCQGQKIERRVEAGGVVVLECPHKTRVFARAF